MSTIIDRPRYLCALGGAISTLSALPRAIPIIHAAAGCGSNLANAHNGAAGYAGSGYCSGLALPSTNVYENEIIFGGEERLKEQIEKTLEVIDGDLYFVLTGCMVEMIGDDVQSVAGQFKEKGHPVYAINTGGFKGNSFWGYDLVLQSLFKEYLRKHEEKDQKLVNLWGVVPVQDVFWKGNLKVLKSQIEKLGFRVNTFFGENETLEALKDAAKASLNIVVSDTFGIEAAKVFELEHNVPYISVPFPIGDHGTERFLNTAGKALGLGKAFIDRVVQGEKKRYYGYLERLADIYSDIDLQRYAVIVGDSNYSQALARFLSDDLGWLPELVIITDDNLSDEDKSLILTRFDDYESGLKPKVVFDTHTSGVVKEVNTHWAPNNGQRYYNSFSPSFIVGSSFERDAAERLGASHLSVTYPVCNRVVLDRAYAGYEGALRLTEDIFGALVAGR
ncbi:MAG: vnfD 1 [Eubacterium sp.]|nr:vnfD 1 [Eubacterium sp.]